MRNIIGVSLLLFVVCCYADKRLYPVMGADGRMTMVEIPSDTEVDKAVGDKSKSIVKKDEVSNKAAPKVAEYDGDVYTSSEDLESASHSVKKPIAMVRDPLGQYVNLREDSQTPPDEASSVIAPTKNAAKVFGNQLEVFSENQIGQVMSGENCISLKKYKPVLLTKKEWQMLIMDKKTEIFIKPKTPVEVFEFPEKKLQDVVIRSYAKKIKSPEFFSPIFAFLNEQGCFVRALGSVFDQFYAANDFRFSMLEGVLPVRGNEKFLVVIFPEEMKVHNEYQVSRYGQLGIRVKP